MSANLIAAAHRRGRRLADRLPPPEFLRSDYGCGFDVGLSNIDPPDAPTRDFQRGWRDGQAVFQRSITPGGTAR